MKFIRLFIPLLLAAGCNNIPDNAKKITLLPTDSIKFIYSSSSISNMMSQSHQLSINRNLEAGLFVNVHLFGDSFYLIRQTDFLAMKQHIPGMSSNAFDTRSPDSTIGNAALALLTIMKNHLHSPDTLMVIKHKDKTSYTELNRNKYAESSEYRDFLRNHPLFFPLKDNFIWPGKTWEMNQEITEAGIQFNNRQQCEVKNLNARTALIICNGSPEPLNKDRGFAIEGTSEIETTVYLNLSDGLSDSIKWNENFNLKARKDKLEIPVNTQRSTWLKRVN